MSTQLKNITFDTSIMTANDVLQALEGKANKDEVEEALSYRVSMAYEGDGVWKISNTLYDTSKQQIKF